VLLLWCDASHVVVVYVVITVDAVFDDTVVVLFFFFCVVTCVDVVNVVDVVVFGLLHIDDLRTHSYVQHCMI